VSLSLGSSSPCAYTTLTCAVPTFKDCFCASLGSEHPSLTGERRVGCVGSSRELLSSLGDASGFPHACKVPCHTARSSSMVERG
jgi:hypothetical protein